MELEGFLRGTETDGDGLTRAGRFACTHAPEIRYLASLIGPGQAGIGVDVNGGKHAFTLAHLAGPAGQVIRVEPLPKRVQYLRRAAIELGLPLVAVYCALSDRTGVVDLHIPLVQGRLAMRRPACILTAQITF